MGKEKAERAVREPRSFLARPLKADFKGLFVSLTKAVVAGITFQWVDAAGAAAEALTAIGVEGNDAGELAWLLLRRAMVRAVYDVVGDSADLLTEKHEEAGLEKFADEVDKGLAGVEVKVNAALFDRPEDLAVVGVMRESLVRWAKGLGADEARAGALAGRLPGCFVYHLSEEWRRGGGKYAGILEVVQSPFLAAEERGRLWASYVGWLQRLVDEPMLGEPFGLRRVYVPLRAYFEKREKGVKREMEAMKREEGKRERVVVDLKTAVDQWVDKGEAGDAMRVVTGGPGCGKSSFARMYAAERARRFDFPVLYVPLHQFDVKGDLAESVDAFCKLYEMLPSGVLDAKTGERRILLIFDGLDELSKQGKGAYEAAREFLHQVEWMLSARDAMELRVQVLVMGRPVAVQAQESEFRKEGEILHVLPYRVTEDYVDPAGLLKVDQRQEWWKRFGEASGQGYEGLPEELDREDLHEVTGQPLLNYLLSLSYRREKIDFEKSVSLNELYADLFEAVYERGWEKRPTVTELKFEEFGRVMEEIALSTWHGGGRTTTVKAIEEHCQQGGMTGLLERFQEGAKEGVTRLLTAFYFRQGSKVGDEATFEFTHKSFGEYLTARRIVRQLRWSHSSLAAREQDLDKGCDRTEALKRWAMVCGPTGLDEGIVRFLHAEIELGEKAAAGGWQGMLCDLIAHMLRHGMPMHEVSQCATYLEERRQARNAEEAMLVCLNGCAEVTGEVSRVHRAIACSFPAATI